VRIGLNMKMQLKMSSVQQIILGCGHKTKVISLESFPWLSGGLSSVFYVMFNDILSVTINYKSL